jgi:starch phosphorylase
VLDGWWCEGYHHDAGWAIGHGETYSDNHYADDVESNTLYDLLAKEVIPLFYKRGRDQMPRHWIKMMKHSIRELTPQFSTSRMVAEYAERFYIPSAKRWNQFGNGGLERAAGLADWKAGMRDRWPEVAVTKVDTAHQGELPVGSDLTVRCQVKLGTIDPNDVSVELVYGLVDSAGQVENGEVAKMEPVGKGSEGQHVFSGNIPCQRSGLCGFSVRVIPQHPDLANKYDTGLICWDNETVSEPTREKATKES